MPDGAEAGKAASREAIRSFCQSVALPISMLPAMKMEGEVMGARAGATSTVDEEDGDVAISQRCVGS